MLHRLTFLSDNCTHEMRGCVRQTPARIREVLEAINATASRPSPDTVGPALTSAAVKTCLQAMELYHSIPRLRFGQEEAFKTLWAHGVPIVVDLQNHFEGIWSPATLRQLYSNEEVTMLTVDPNGEISSESVKLSTFFDRFEAAGTQTNLHAVKMKVSVREITVLFHGTDMPLGPRTGRPVPIYARRVRQSTGNILPCCPSRR